MQYHHCLFYPLLLLLRHGLGNVVRFGNIVASSLSLNRNPAAKSQLSLFLLEGSRLGRQ